MATESAEVSTLTKALFHISSAMPIKASNIALFDLTDKARAIKFLVTTLNSKEKYAVRDLLQKKDLETFKIELNKRIAAHQTALVKLTSIN